MTDSLRNQFESHATWAYVGALVALGITVEPGTSRRLALRTRDTQALTKAIELLRDLHDQNSQDPVRGVLLWLDSDHWESIRRTTDEKA